MRESDPSAVLLNPSGSITGQSGEATTDLEHDNFSSYFSETPDSSFPPKVLITTSTKATKATYDFCDELVGVFPGAEFVQRKKGKGSEMGRIAGWAAERGYKHMCVINEDMRKPSKAYIPQFCIVSSK
jgi:ribosome production factor 1